MKVSDSKSWLNAFDPQEVIRVTNEGVKRSVFGAPTFFVGEEMFWGKDRLDFVEDSLRKEKG